MSLPFVLGKHKQASIQSLGHYELVARAGRGTLAGMISLPFGVDRMIVLSHKHHDAPSSGCYLVSLSLYGLLKRSFPPCSFHQTPQLTTFYHLLINNSLIYRKKQVLFQNSIQFFPICVKKENAEKVFPLLHYFLCQFHILFDQSIQKQALRIYLRIASPAQNGRVSSAFISILPFQKFFLAHFPLSLSSALL